MVKMFKLVGEDKEYGVIKNWGRIPIFQARPGHDTFFALLRTGLSVAGLNFDCVRYLDEADIVLVF